MKEIDYTEITEITVKSQKDQQVKKGDKMKKTKKKQIQEECKKPLNDPSGKCWTCTTNNPTKTDEEFEEYLDNLMATHDLQYWCFRREKAPSTGTVHFQFFVVFKIRKHFSSVQKIFPKTHLIISSGSKQENRDYCYKTEKEGEYTALGDFYENGNWGVEQRQRTDINNILALIYSGTPLNEVRELYPTQYFMYPKRFEQARKDYLKTKFSKIFRQLEVIYISGSTAVGKSRYVYDKYGYENVFTITNYNRFAFDGYEGQDVILLEEYRSKFDISYLLQVLDGHPLRIEVKGGHEQACWTKVFITSNWEFLRQHNDLKIIDNETYDAFVRRVHKVFDFNNYYHRQALQNNTLITPEQMTLILDPKQLENLPFK